MERFNSTSQFENKFENGSYSVHKPIVYVETFSTYNFPKNTNSTFVNGNRYEYETLLNAIFKNEKKVTHILQTKHRWNELVPDLDDKKIAGIMKYVITYGKDISYKSGGAKSKRITSNGVTKEVQVPYKIKNGTFYFSDAWVIM
jgi:Bacterial toxin 35